MSTEPAPAASADLPEFGRFHRMADRLPSWMGSIRFRLTVLYSLLLFGLAAAVVGGLYAGLARALDDQPVSRTYVVQQPVLTPDGPVIREETFRAEFRTLEQLVNQRALDQLRTYSFAALGGLFVASLGVGWVVAGRVLAPIGRISAVARNIQATDLSRRIALNGPRDELRDLADTFDAMLGRIDEAFEGQRRFIHEASHELRNPLAVIRTNLDVALADPDASVDELRRTAMVVNRTADRMTHLVDHLLVYARSGAPPREMGPVNLAEVAADTVDEFAAPADSRQLRLEVDAPDDVVVCGDRTAIKQAAANLVDNAVRLAPRGTTIRVSAAVRDEWALLSVADEGPGIRDEHQDAVFQRFWRGSNGDEGDARRSGLGLTIVRQIAESHGGHVTLASEVGVGSTFAVWLPPLTGSLGADS